MKTLKNGPQKLLIIGPNLFFHSPAQPTAHSPKLIFHIINMSQNSSVSLSVTWSKCVNISKIHSLVLDSSWTGADETHPYHFCKIAQNGSRKSGLKSLEVRQKSKGVKRHAVKGQNVMLHMLYDIGAMGLLGHKLSSNSREAKNLEPALCEQIYQNF